MQVNARLPLDRPDLILALAEQRRHKIEARQRHARMEREQREMAECTFRWVGHVWVML